MKTLFGAGLPYTAAASSLRCGSPTSAISRQIVLHIPFTSEDARSWIVRGQETGAQPIHFDTVRELLVCFARRDCRETIVVASPETSL